MCALCWWPLLPATRTWKHCCPTSGSRPTPSTSCNTAGMNRKPRRRHGVVAEQIAARTRGSPARRLDAVCGGRTALQGAVLAYLGRTPTRNENRARPVCIGRIPLIDGPTRLTAISASAADHPWTQGQPGGAYRPRDADEGAAGGPGGLSTYAAARCFGRRPASAPARGVWFGRALMRRVRRPDGGPNPTIMVLPKPFPWLRDRDYHGWQGWIGRALTLRLVVGAGSLRRNEQTSASGLCSFARIARRASDEALSTRLLAGSQCSPPGRRQRANFGRPLAGAGDMPKPEWSGRGRARTVR